ncbi:MAG: lysophospholipid acyltransferase family protein [Gemmataceae bacterium]
MSKKVRSKSVDYLVYLIVRGLVCVLQGLPRRMAFGFAEGLGWLAHRINKRHRLVAAENLRFAYPEKPPAEIDRLVRDCYRHFCRMLVEMILLPRVLRVENYQNYARFTDLTPSIRGLIGNRPVLFVLGHHGNWELAGYALGAMGFKTYAIARVLDNPYLNEFLNSFRERTGQTIIAKKDDFDRLSETLSTGGKVATLADQDAGPRGVFVNFFGRPASAHKAVALMAIEFDAVMLVTGITRTGNGIGPTGFDSSYEIICEEVIDPRDYADRGDAIKAITQRYHDALERIIRRHPEQYFWLHRRWKSQPAAKKAKPPLAVAA